MRVLLTALVAVFLCFDTAYGEPYVEATGGLAIFQDAHTDRWETDFDNASWGGSLAAGYCWTTICLEGEAAHYRTSVDSGFPLTHRPDGADLSITGVTGNVIWQPFNWVVEPYLFGGLGLGYTGFDPTNWDGFTLKEGGSANLGDVGLLSQAGAGLKWQVTQHWSVFTEARYVRLDFASVTGVPHTDATDLLFAGGGLRWSF